MGEAHHLTREERKLLIQTARQLLDDNQLTVQLVAGTGGNSTRETIELTKDAAEAGAQYAMVIAPGKFLRAERRAEQPDRAVRLRLPRVAS